MPAECLRCGSSMRRSRKHRRIRAISTIRRASHVHSLWHLARAQARAAQLQGDDAARLAALLERTGGTALMALRPQRAMRREANVLMLD